METAEHYVDPRDARILQLEQKLAEALAAIEVLKRDNAELRAKLWQNSSNSSKPPSSDGCRYQK